MRGQLEKSQYKNMTKAYSNPQEDRTLLPRDLSAAHAEMPL